MDLIIENDDDGDFATSYGNPMTDPELTISDLSHILLLSDNDKDFPLNFLEYLRGKKVRLAMANRERLIWVLKGQDKKLLVVLGSSVSGDLLQSWDVIPAVLCRLRMSRAFPL